LEIAPYVIRFQKFRPGLDVALLPKFEQISGSKVEYHDVTDIDVIVVRESNGFSLKLA